MEQNHFHYIFLKLNALGSTLLKIFIRFYYDLSFSSK